MKILRNAFLFFFIIAISTISIYYIYKHYSIKHSTINKKIRIAVLNDVYYTNKTSNEITNSFFKMSNDIISYAAKSLECEVGFFIVPPGKSDIEEQLTKIVNDFSPDGILIVGGSISSSKILDVAEKIRIPVVSYNTKLYTNSSNEYLPGISHKFWIAQITPDDFQAGKLLADELITRTESAGVSRVNLIAFSGSSRDNASKDRLRGLHKSLSEHSKSNLLQVFTTEFYNYNTTRDKFHTIVRERFPDVNTVWCANDVIASAVVDECISLGLIPGKDIHIGGIDWQACGLNNIKKGHMELSVGEHFMEGAWGLIMLFDYLNGNMHVLKERSRKSENFIIADKGNINKVVKYIDNLLSDGFSYRPFSMTYNSSQQKYHFSIKSDLSDHNFTP